MVTASSHQSIPSLTSTDLSWLYPEPPLKLNSHTGHRLFNLYIIYSNVIHYTSMSSIYTLYLKLKIFAYIYSVTYQKIILYVSIWMNLYIYNRVSDSGYRVQYGQLTPNVCNVVLSWKVSVALQLSNRALLTRWDGHFSIYIHEC